MKQILKRSSALRRFSERQMTFFFYFLVFFFPGFFFFTLYPKVPIVRPRFRYSPWEYTRSPAWFNSNFPFVSRSVLPIPELPPHWQETYGGNPVLLLLSLYTPDVDRTFFHDRSILKLGCFSTCQMGFFPFVHISVPNVHRNSPSLLPTSLSSDSP